jgi:hypothetical protein
MQLTGRHVADRGQGAQRGHGPSVADGRFGCVRNRRAGEDGSSGRRGPSPPGWQEGTSRRSGPVRRAGRWRSGSRTVGTARRHVRGPTATRRARPRRWSGRPRRRWPAAGSPRCGTATDGCRRRPRRWGCRGRAHGGRARRSGRRCRSRRPPAGRAAPRRPCDRRGRAPAAGAGPRRGRVGVEQVRTEPSQRRVAADASLVEHLDDRRGEAHRDRPRGREDHAGRARRLAPAFTPAGRGARSRSSAVGVDGQAVGGPPAGACRAPRRGRRVRPPGGGAVRRGGGRPA